MNSAEFAESQGFSRAYVTKLVQQGVIVRDAKGQTDKDSAVAALASRREPAKALRRGRTPRMETSPHWGAVGGLGNEALSDADAQKSHPHGSRAWEAGRT
jgi:hypothetical protein